MCIRILISIGIRIIIDIVIGVGVRIFVDIGIGSAVNSTITYSLMAKLLSNYIYLNLDCIMEKPGVCRHPSGWVSSSVVVKPT